MTVENLRQAMKVRREVLGNEYVDKALTSTTEFTKPYQEMATEYCWGTVWGRKELDRKSRSLITLAILTANGQSKELQNHVRGAINNGCTPEEIREVFIHATVYCGLPAGGIALRAATEVLDEMARPKG